MSNPAENLEISKGATLRDNASTVLKNGGPVDDMDVTMGHRKMSL